MNTLVTGFNKEVRNLLVNALSQRHHDVFVSEPTDEALKKIDENSISLIIISDYSNEAIQFCKLIRAREYGRKYTIFAVITQDQTDFLDKLIDADIDQYIIESLFDEQRLDVRL